MTVYSKIEKILLDADIKILFERDEGFGRKWDIKINNGLTTKENLFKRILGGGSLAFGESYMEGWWDSENLSETIFRIFRHADFSKIINIGILPHIIKNKIFNLQSGKRAYQVGQKHYDIGNDLYEKMLDKSTMSYTCGYWNDAENLDQAQIAKLDLICKKLNLKKGQRILDIGCGWGNFMKYAAENYGVSCVGLSVSVEQTKLGKERCAGLPIEFVVQDYQKYVGDEKFDAIVSIEMIEAVGDKNLRKYFETISNNLKSGGLCLIQVIVNSEKYSSADKFVDKYIFPNGFLPSMFDIIKNISAKRANVPNSYVVEDVHNFGNHYYLTLEEWYKSFDNSFPELAKNNSKYDIRFYRMWKYYLLLCSGIFKARYIQLWQIVLSKKGVEGGYNSVR